MFSEVINKFLFLAIELSEWLSPFINRSASGLGGTAAFSSILGPENFGILLIAFLVFSFFIIGLSLGRSRLMIGMISVYVAYFLSGFFPFYSQIDIFLKQVQNYQVKIGFFLFFYILTLLFLGRSLARARFSLNEIPFFTILFLSIIHGGFMASVLINFLPPEIIEKISPAISNYFISKESQFAWAILPVLSFLFLGKKKNQTTIDN